LLVSFNELAPLWLYRTDIVVPDMNGAKLAADPADAGPI
jgi:hypothetical protein